MLNDIRVSNVTEEAKGILSQRLIERGSFQTYKQLQQSGMVPVCMFATRKACSEFNDETLQSLPSEKHEIICTDKIDETACKKKWTKCCSQEIAKNE